jgi:hypothetical protein
MSARKGNWCAVRGSVQKTEGRVPAGQGSLHARAVRARPWGLSAEGKGRMAGKFGGT